jgi:radical SAM superfamily enzyme YgiQ (UPF0313 family)
MPTILKNKGAQPNMVLNKSFLGFLNNLKNRYLLDKNVTLIHCPNFSFQSFNPEVAKHKGYYSYPPTGLQCLKAALTELDYSVDIFDMNYILLKKICHHDPEEPLNVSVLLDEYFEAHEASIVGVSAGVVVSDIFDVKNHPFIQTLEYLREKNKHLVLAGGVIATNEWKNLLRKNLVHFAFRGESENKVISLIRHLEGESGAHATSGIHFKYNGQYEETVGEKDVVNFNWDIISTYKDICIEDYHNVGCLSPFSRMIGTEKTYTTLQLNRGCRAHCTFCGVTPFMGLGVRQYPVDAVINELIYLVRERGVQHFEWLDDDLLENRSAIVEVMKRIIKLKLGVTWAGNNGMIATSLDEELLQLMVESGCVGFRIGIESGNEEMLKRIKKPASLKTLAIASQMLAKFPDLFVVGCYIIGFKNETYGQIIDTFKLGLSMNLSWSGWSVCQVLRDFNVDNEFETDEYDTILPFVPSKENADGTIKTDRQRQHYPEVLKLPLQEVPDREQLKELWFAFNLISNYILNTNLKPGGREGLFINWAVALQLGHPGNPVISLFLFLAYKIVGDDILAKKQFASTEAILRNSDYWRQRFDQYELNTLLLFPESESKFVTNQLRDFQEKYESVVESL